MKSILLIDDDLSFTDIASSILELEGYVVWCAENPVEAFKLLFEHEFDLVICDLHMPFTSGKEQEEYPNSLEVGFRTARELHEALPSESRIIVLSSTPAAGLSRLSGFLHPIPLHSKPGRGEELVDIVRGSLEEEEQQFQIQAFQMLQ